jgi:ribokinase
VPGRVIVVGSVNVDLVAAVDRLPGRGETVTGATFNRYPGGKGGNQATAAARLGAAVSFVGAVGSDLFGAEARDALAAEAIDVAELAPTDGATGVALIVVEASGENVIAVASGANGSMSSDFVEAALGRLRPSPGDVVLVSNEIPKAAVRAALAEGRRVGAVTVLNPAPAGGLDRSHLRFVDILVPNRGELADLVGLDDRRTGRPQTSAPRSVSDGAAVLLAENSEGAGVARAVLVTLGGDGAVLVTPGESPRRIAAPAVRVVDTVGAGDTVVGALAAGLAEGRDLDDAAARAVVAATLSATRAGARSGMPSLAELEAALTAR